MPAGIKCQDILPVFQEFFRKKQGTFRHQTETDALSPSYFVHIFPARASARPAEGVNKM